MIKQRKDDDYCVVYGVIHTNTRQYELCDYCLHQKRWMYPRVVYYRHGFAKKDVLMCDDCHKIERRFHESRLTTHVTEHNVYEAICLTIKEKTSSTTSNSFLLHNSNISIDKETGNGIVVIDYYDAVRIAYHNSTDVREYLRCAIEDINKDLQIIWKFTYLYNQLQLTTSELTKANDSLAESNKQLTLLNKQLAEANEQLKINDKMQKEFINIAAHELRGPIQPILGLTEVLRNKTTDKEQRELQDAVFRSAKKLKQLTEDVLDVTRIESQSLQLHKEQFNLTEMILNTIVDCRNQIKKEYKDTIKLELVSNEDIFVEADRSRLNQVISNILNNAIKFTEQEGMILTTVEKKDNYAIVSVKDTGTGIDPEILPRLFTKFATKSEAGGTGLGLFISKNIVESHDGRIWAENNHDGIGSTFYLSLPLIE